MSQVDKFAATLQNAATSIFSKDSHFQMTTEAQRMEAGRLVSSGILTERAASEKYKTTVPTIRVWRRKYDEQTKSVTRINAVLRPIAPPPPPIAALQPRAPSPDFTDEEFFSNPAFLADVDALEASALNPPRALSPADSFDELQFTDADLARIDELATSASTPLNSPPRVQSPMRGVEMGGTRGAVFSPITSPSSQLVPFSNGSSTRGTYPPLATNSLIPGSGYETEEDLVSSSQELSITDEPGSQVFSSQEQTPLASQTLAKARKRRPTLNTRRNSSSASARNLVLDFAQVEAPLPRLPQEFKIDADVAAPYRHFIRHLVAGDGDCGYTAFGITRTDALQLLLSKSRQEPVRKCLKLVIKENLITENFYNYLLHNQLTSLAHEHLISNLEQVSEDLVIQQAYIEYDVQHKNIDAGWSHPSILQALAYIQNIELHIWRLDQDSQLIPHKVHDQDYSVCKPLNAQTRMDLLFVHGNHFERLEFTDSHNATAYNQKMASEASSWDANAPLADQHQNPAFLGRRSPTVLEGSASTDSEISDLFTACANNAASTVRRLLRHNYKWLNEINTEGKTPGQVAKENSHYFVILEIFFSAIKNNDLDRSSAIIDYFNFKSNFRCLPYLKATKTAVLELIDLYMAEEKLGSWEISKGQYSSTRTNPLEKGYKIKRQSKKKDQWQQTFNLSRIQVESLLIENLQSIQEILYSAVEYALTTKEFCEYLYLNHHVTNSSVLNAKNLNIQKAYIMYDVKDQRVDAGWAHPRILQGLAHIKSIALYIWRLGERETLLPYQIYGKNYSAYTPPRPTARIDLLFYNGNHFKILEMKGYEKNCIPISNIFPLSPSSVQHYYNRDYMLNHTTCDSSEHIKRDKLTLIRQMINLWNPHLHSFTHYQLKQYYDDAVQQDGQYFSMDWSDDSDFEDDEYLHDHSKAKSKKQLKRLGYFNRVRNMHTKEFWLKTRRTSPQGVGLGENLQSLLGSTDNNSVSISTINIQGIKSKLINSLVDRGTLAQVSGETEYVALFRGNNYMLDRWSNSARRYHYYLDETGHPQLCESVLKHQSNDFYREMNQDNHYLLNPEIQQSLTELTTVMQNQYQAFTPISYPVASTVTPCQTEQFLFNSTSDWLQHEFSNGIGEHLLLMRDRIRKDPKLWRKCFINAFNYAIATSTRPYHASKYAAGLKEYYADAFPLRYNQDGSLLNSHAGKILLLLCTADEFKKQENLNRVVKKNYAGQVPIGLRILPELEISFIARTPDVIFQWEIKFPSFDKSYKDIYEIKYGLNKCLYENFRNLIKNTRLESPERMAVLDLLKEWLCAYHEVLLLAIAAEEVKKIKPANGRKGKLVYVNHQDISVTTPDQGGSTNGKDNEQTRNKINILENLRWQLGNIGNLQEHFGGIAGYADFCSNKTVNTLEHFLRNAIATDPFIDYIAYVREQTQNITRTEIRNIIKNNAHTLGLPKDSLGKAT